MRYCGYLYSTFEWIVKINVLEVYIIQNFEATANYCIPKNDSEKTNALLLIEYGINNINISKKKNRSIVKF